MRLRVSWSLPLSLKSRSVDLMTPVRIFLGRNELGTKWNPIQISREADETHGKYHESMGVAAPQTRRRYRFSVSTESHYVTFYGGCPSLFAIYMPWLRTTDDGIASARYGKIRICFWQMRFMAGPVIDQRYLAPRNPNPPVKEK